MTGGNSRDLLPCGPLWGNTGLSAPFSGIAHQVKVHSGQRPWGLVSWDAIGDSHGVWLRGLLEARARWHSSEACRGAHLPPPPGAKANGPQRQTLVCSICTAREPGGRLRERQETWTMEGKPAHRLYPCDPNLSAANISRTGSGQVRKRSRSKARGVKEHCTWGSLGSSLCHTMAYAVLAPWATWKKTGEKEQSSENPVLFLKRMNVT